MRFRAFEWDDWNVNHIARHGLEPGDVEGVLRGDVLVLRGRQGRYVAYGCTSAGRYLFVVLHSVGYGAVRVITARDMTDRERRFYRHRRR